MTRQAERADSEALRADLVARVAGRVGFDAGARALYSTDASNYRQVPIGVVLPETVDDAVAAIAVCAAHQAPVLSRGGGTAIRTQIEQTTGWRALHLSEVLDPADP